MVLYDFMIIFTVIIFAVVTIVLVYIFMFSNKKEDLDVNTDKNKIFNLSYNIKKNLLKLLDKEEGLPEEYTELLNKISTVYSKNCSEFEKDNSLNELKKRNKQIKKILISFEKASLSHKEFNNTLYSNYLKKLEQLL